MLAATAALLLVGPPSLAQEPPQPAAPQPAAPRQPSKPCVRGPSGVVEGGLDRDFVRCRELILMEQIFALISKVTDLEAENRLMKSGDRAEPQARK